LNDASEAPVPPAPDASSSDPGLARLSGVFFSPVATFESIARRPTWIAPLLLWTVLSVAVTAVLLPKIDYEQLTRQAMQSRGQSIPEDRIASIVQQQKKIGGIFGWVAGVAFPAIASLLAAVVVWGAFKAFGWDSRFSQAFGVTTHAFLPGVLKAALLLFLITRLETVNPQALGDLLTSNLGFLVPRDSSKPLHALLQSLDIFSLWSLCLFVVGFAAAARVKRGAAAGVIVTLWLLTVGIRVGWNAIF
jgi:hypothetical protein